jgi:hypothetical protein
VGNQNQVDYPQVLDRKQSSKKHAGIGGTQTVPSYGSDIPVEKIDEMMERRPQVLSVSQQQLKNSTKIAKVLVVDENPIPTQSQSVDNVTRGSIKDNSELMGSIDKKSIGGNKVDIQPKALMIYPEEQHKPMREICQQFNARIMKHLMK